MADSDILSIALGAETIEGDMRPICALAARTGDCNID